MGRGRATAAVGWVGTPEGMLWQGAAGSATLPPPLSPPLSPDGPVPVTTATLFDLASISKVFAATLALVLDGGPARQDRLPRNRLPLDRRIGDIWPGRADPALAPRTLEDLLRHRSGLEAWAPLYHLCSDPGEVLELLLSGQLSGARAGTYSDLGLILYALAVEEALDRPLSALLEAEVLGPLKLRGVGLAPSLPAAGSASASGLGVAVSPLTTGKEVQLAQKLNIEIEALPAPDRGTVQDGNARFLAEAMPFPGHAGLFGTAADVAALAAEWLRPGRLLDPAAVREALIPQPSRSRRLLGWARADRRGSGGPALSPAAWGHTGFTGGSVFADPARGAVYVLLAAAASYAESLLPERRRFHQLGARLVGRG